MAQNEAKNEYKAQGKAQTKVGILLPEQKDLRISQYVT